MSLAVSAAVLFALSTPGHASEPVREVRGSLDVPAELTPEAALASVGDISTIFALYEPVIPKIPGVQVDLDKQVVSASAPTVLELPVRGSALGRKIEERARVTAVTEETPCAGPGTPDGPIGRKITLDFTASSYNIERRISHIEITACPSVDRQGHPKIEATGRMFAGYLPEDPGLNAISESIGAKAFQGAFIKQVPAMLSAVEAHWASLIR